MVYILQQGTGSDALQPKLPRRKAKLAEHRKQRKLKAKGRSRATAEEGAGQAGVTASIAASWPMPEHAHLSRCRRICAQSSDRAPWCQDRCRPRPVHGGVV